MATHQAVLIPSSHICFQPQQAERQVLSFSTPCPREGLVAQSHGWEGQFSGGLWEDFSFSITWRSSAFCLEISSLRIWHLELWKPLCNRKRNAGESETLTELPLVWGCQVNIDPVAFWFNKQCMLLFYIYLYLFILDRGEGRGQGGREGNINVLPLAHPALGTWPTTQACALDWESNWWPFGLQVGSQSTEPPARATVCVLKG